jgi:hypothetical protein
MRFHATRETAFCHTGHAPSLLGGRGLRFLRGRRGGERCGQRLVAAAWYSYVGVGGCSGGGGGRSKPDQVLAGSGVTSKKKSWLTKQEPEAAAEGAKTRSGAAGAGAEGGGGASALLVLSKCIAEYSLFTSTTSRKKQN